MSGLFPNPAGAAANAPPFRPSLLIDFANSRAVDSRIAATRASAAYSINKNGKFELIAAGVPRLDFDPITGRCKGVLVEPVRTNNLLRSREYDNVAWTKTRSSASAAAAMAPDGALTAQKIVEDTSTGTHLVTQVITPAGNTQYALIVYVKAAGRGFAGITIGSFANQVAGNNINIDLSTGAYTATDPSRAAVIGLLDGWYAVLCTSTTVASPSSLSCTINLSNSLGNTSYTGDGVSGILLWHSTLGPGSDWTMPIETTTAQVTRAVDSLVLSSANLTSWVNSARGTLLVKTSAGWAYNDTPPSSPLDLAKSITDYTTQLNATIERVLFYPRVLSAAQRAAITA